MLRNFLILTIFIKDIVLAKIPVKNIFEFLLGFRAMIFKIQKLALALKFTKHKCLQKCALELFWCRLAVQSSILCDIVVSIASFFGQLQYYSVQHVQQGVHKNAVK